MATKVEFLFVADSWIICN